MLPCFCNIKDSSDVERRGPFMIKTKKIEDSSEEIDRILDNWGFTRAYGSREDKRATVVRWLHNFQPSEFEDALLVLKNIQ